SKSSKNKDPMRAVDPRPIRSPSPPRGNSYPPPPAKSPRPAQSPSQSQSQPPGDPYNQPRYNPQDYAGGTYNPQSFSPQPEYSTQQNYTTQNYGPQDYGPETSRPYNPQDYPPPTAATGPPTGPAIAAPVLPIRPESDSRPITDQTKMPSNAPGGMTDVMRPSTQVAPTIAPNSLRELQALRTNCQFGLREFLSLQRQRKSGELQMSSSELDMRLRDTTYHLLSDLRVLQGEVRGIAKEAESHRWRRWIIGGAIASFIPIIRRFWRRGNDEESQTSANDTEYAFVKSKGLLDHIKDGVFGSGYLAKLAFFVFAVLYVFSNEVSLRVARTTNKRIKKLCARIEQGDPDIDEKDMKALEGWRWRVLLW
ncbi:hypothetical protein BGZ63DRAFT_318505, partial [Mariannaea sp. PMI_226]